MLCIFRAGDRCDILKDNYEYSLRDGAFLRICDDDGFGGSSYGYNLIAFRVSTDYNKFIQNNSNMLLLQEYMMPKVQGKLPQDSGYISPESLSTQFSKFKTRRRDWFVDFEWLRKQGYITQKQYDSIYKFSEKTPIIDLGSVDFTTILKNEEATPRLKPYIKNNAWASGTKVVASGGTRDYDMWEDAFDAMDDPMTGDAIVESGLNEVINTVAWSGPVLDTNLAGYTFTMRAGAGTGHTGTFNGHTIRSLTGYNVGISVNETLAGGVDNVIVQDLCFDVRLHTSYGVYLYDGGDAGHIIIERCIAKGDNCIGTNCATTGFHQGYSAVNVVFRNNIAYKFIKTALGHGFYIYNEWGTPSTQLYNNTACKNRYGFRLSHPARTTGTIILKNNLSQGSLTSDYITGSAIDTHDKNVSEDATSPDASYQSLNCHDGNSCFNDYDNDDFSLVETGDEITTLALADDLSAIGSPEQFSDDCIGTTR